MALIPPKRSELLTQNGFSTLRLTTFFEDLARNVNQTVEEVDTELGASTSIAFISALRNDLTELYDQVDLLTHKTNSAPEGLVKWRGDYDENYIYQAGDFVRQNGWSAVANKRTIDSVEPPVIGTANYLLGDAPTWTQLNQDALVTAGQKYTFTQSTRITEIRVWPKNGGAGVTNKLITLDITDPNTPIYNEYLLTNLTPDEWQIVEAGNRLIPAGSTFIVALQTLNSSSNTTITGNWRYDGTSDNGTPDSQGWNKRNQNNIIRIDKTDLGSLDRSAELLAVTPQSTIEVIQTNSVGNNATYVVTTAPSDQGTYIEYQVTANETNGTIDENASTTINIDTPIAAGVDYVSIPSYFPANEPNWANVDGFLAFDGVEQAVPNNIHGIDISGIIIEQSDDWDLVSYTDF